jgi:hypothetical protein
MEKTQERRDEEAPAAFGAPRMVRGTVVGSRRPLDAETTRGSGDVGDLGEERGSQVSSGCWTHGASRRCSAMVG